MVQRTRELHAEVAEKLREREKAFRDDDRMRDRLVLPAHPEAAASLCMQAALNGEGRGECDGGYQPRQVSLQPHRAADGIKGNPLHGWGNERSEQYALGTNQAVYQMVLELHLGLASTQIELQRLRRELDDLRGAADEGSRGRGAQDDKLGSLEKNIADLQRRVGGRDELAGDIRALNFGVDELANAVGDAGLRRRIADRES